MNYVLRSFLALALVVLGSVLVMAAEAKPNPIPGLDAYRVQMVAKINAAHTPEAKKALQSQVEADLMAWAKTVDVRPVPMDPKDPYKYGELNGWLERIGWIADEKSPHHRGVIHGEALGLARSAVGFEDPVALYKKYKGPLPAWKAKAK
jgi:hypothetical protein